MHVPTSSLTIIDSINQVLSSDAVHSDIEPVVSFSSVSFEIDINHVGRFFYFIDPTSVCELTSERLYNMVDFQTSDLVCFLIG